MSAIRTPAAILSSITGNNWRTCAAFVCGLMFDRASSGSVFDIFNPCVIRLLSICTLTVSYLSGICYLAVIYLFTSCYLSVAFLLFPLRSDEHTSELQSRGHLICRLLL